MLRVWVDNQPVGRLDRTKNNGTTFTYDENVPADKAVSLTMPVQTESYTQRNGMLPIFGMNVPEGGLKIILTERFAKALGKVDDMDLLQIVGRHTLGRIKFTPLDETLNDDTPSQSIDEILSNKRDGNLYNHLMSQFAEYSGLSGAQPKFMMRSDNDTETPRTIKSATHIVKFSDDNFPGLSANEYFCMKAARRAGLDTAECEMSDDGEALIVKRFDTRPDGSCIGMEDACSLTGTMADRKYEGSIEGMTKALKANLGSNWNSTRKDVFKLIVLNCVLRNGDAHLKNFSVLYDSPLGEVRLSPVYDIVTNCAYAGIEEGMAMTYAGSTKWPDPKKLLQMGTARFNLKPAEIKEVIDSVVTAVAETHHEMTDWFKNSDHQEVGERMSKNWQDGMKQTIGYVVPEMDSTQDHDAAKSVKPK